MFKQANKAPPRFRKRGEVGSELPQGVGAKKALLSFESEELGSPRKKHKKKLRRPTSDLPVAEVEAVGRSYDAASLAELRASQVALPAEVAAQSAAEAAMEEDDDEGVVASLEARVASARRERAAQRDEGEPAAVESDRVLSEDDGSEDGVVPLGSAVMEAAEFIPIGASKLSAIEEAHRERWLRGGADAGDVDAPVAGGSLARGAARVGDVADDDDDELAAWEHMLMARGSVNTPFAVPQSTGSLRRRRPPESLEELVERAAEEEKSAQREVEARRVQLAEHEGLLASAVADAAKADANLRLFQAAHHRLLQAIEAYQRSQKAEDAYDVFRRAMAEAVAMVEPVDETGTLRRVYSTAIEEEDAIRAKGHEDAI